jgi:uncharacterized protein (TIGR02452 family)
MGRDKQNRVDGAQVSRETIAALRKGAHNGKRLPAGPPFGRVIQYDSAPMSGDDRDRTRRSPSVTLFAGDSFDAAAWVSARSTSQPLVLDFASDSVPGGGWLGSQQGTQEESLCRRSSLGLALGTASYPFCSAHTMVYARDVLVFRAPVDYRFLDRPFRVAVVAAALRCVSDVPGPTGSVAKSQARFVASKFDALFHLAAEHGHDAMVLGAWGCGAFGNPPLDIAAIASAALEETRARAPVHVVFALPQPEHRAAFASVFARAESVDEGALEVGSRAEESGVYALDCSLPCSCAGSPETSESHQVH